MSRIELQPAFVLHHRPYRNTSIILDAITLHHGRIGVVAKGARRGKQQQASLLQPFQQLLLSWSGRGELFSMTSVEDVTSGEPPVVLKGETLFYGYYVNELTLKLLPRDDPHPEIFAIYNQTLRTLYNVPADRESALRVYEITLLDALGYQLVTEYEVSSGDKIEPLQSYRYIADQGPVYASKAARAGVPLTGQTLLDVGQRDFSLPETLIQSRRLLRMLVDFHLEGRPLKTRELFRSLYAGSSGIQGLQ